MVLDEGVLSLPDGQVGRPLVPSLSVNCFKDSRIESVDTVIIEPGSNGAVHGKVIKTHMEFDTVTLKLFANVMERVFRALLIVLVHSYDVGEIEHVDFFQLALSTEAASHYV